MPVISERIDLKSHAYKNANTIFWGDDPQAQAHAAADKDGHKFFYAVLAATRVVYCMHSGLCAPHLG